MSKYIIEVDDNGVVNSCYPIVGTNNVLVSPNGLDTLEKYEENDNELSFPQLGDGYFYIGANGCVNPSTYSDDRTDDVRIKIGNFFRTEEEAKFAVERLKVLSEMRKFAEPFDTKWDGVTHHYYIYYSLNEEKLAVSALNSMRCNELYFESRERAKECINVVGEDKIKEFYIGIK